MGSKFSDILIPLVTSRILDNATVYPLNENEQMYLIKQLKITIQLQTEIIAFTLSVTENENASMGFLRITGDSFLYS